MEQARASVESDLAQAHSLLAELRATNTAAGEAMLRCLAEIQDAVALQPPLDDGRIERLRPWLATLRDTIEHGNWTAARVGLDRWRSVATEYLTAARTAGAANRAPLEQRDQLAGLLRARCVQRR